jgi:hypothetical protein
MGRAKPLPIDRPDAPKALLDLIHDCLQPLPANRPADMLQVLHRLQLAETEIGLRPSPLELARQQPAPVPEVAGPDGQAGTATGRLESLGAQSTAGTKRRKRRASTRGEDTMSGADDATRLRGAIQMSNSVSRRWWMLGTAAAVVLALAVVLLWWKPWSSGPGVVTGLEGSPGQGSVNFTWRAPADGSADGYVIQVRTRQPGQRVCLSVKVLHGRDVGQPVGPRCARSGAAGTDEPGSAADTNSGVSQ